MEKNELRKTFLAARAALTAEQHRAADAAIVEQVRSLPEYRAAHWIGLYAGDGDEVDLSALVRLDGGKKIFAFPRYVPEKKEYEMVGITDPATDLIAARYGLLEPRRDLPALDDTTRQQRLLFLVPAVACDAAGNRLGRGGGFYDRLLAGVESPKIAVVYECQMANELPVQPHDQRMDFVVTGNRIIKGGKACIC